MMRGPDGEATTSFRGCSRASRRRTDGTLRSRDGESASVGIRHVRRLGEQEAVGTVRILKSAARWSERFGEPMWQTSDFTPAGQRAIARLGELFGGFDGACLSSCMRLQSDDALFWPDDPPGEAIYIHKVAVLRKAAGSGWLPSLIDFAAQNAIAKGAKYLRLDTLPRARLASLYEARGFRQVDPAPGAYNGRLMIRMELALRHQGHPPP